ncbi:TetR/AcrR family transcriptional regulator [Kibdelosporangium philippinense]|uniref:TetR/AcrR family transcriptional regulator n=1 Tax=Kibdelosporangium philippinense TaxID=211113 RepID=A0ABS8ZNK6_9PSEU|nr:helix-turn-helix domain-containing protein [Kibdelosporangium philippinense]MCE7008216.1 TetR/AcrR family transcriptional regulator [Kibdelosporangium philippinense]
MQEPGLRERKKARTREAITEAAFALFEKAGFDSVTVADIAAAAEVSKPTLFAYFSTKEDLVLHRFLDSRGPAEVVRDNPGVPALTALHASFLDRLTDRDPLTGLNDTPSAITFHNLLYTTPSLMARLAFYMIDQEQRLVTELLASGQLTNNFSARLLAAELFGAQRILGTHNAMEIHAGATADEVHPAAVTRANAAFDFLTSGLVRLA